MEVKPNRFGTEYVYEKIDSNRIRVTGQCHFTDVFRDSAGNIRTVSMESGPTFEVGHVVMYGGISWKITKIVPVETKYADLVEIILTVVADYK